MLAADTQVDGGVRTVVWAVPLAGGAPTALSDPGRDGAAFPGPPDPAGQYALAVTASDAQDGHTEQAWLFPLRPEQGPRVRLTPPAGALRNPAWAPDGRWLAFESDAASFRDLYRVDRDGNGLTRLTDAPNGSFEPDVSPDGAKIAFGTSRDGNAEVYVMDSDGAHPTRITDHPSDDVHPRWSPTGSLAWLAHRDGIPRVWLAAADGSGAHPLRPGDGAEDRDFAWSPDGKRLAVVVATRPAPNDPVRAVSVAIDVLDAATGARIARLDSDGVDEQPSWSPDGAWIAYTEGHGATAKIVVATPDGRARREVGAGGKAEWLPRWTR